MSTETTDEAVDAEVERILAMTDEEVIAELVAEGRDPKVVADQVRAIVEKVIAMCREQRE